MPDPLAIAREWLSPGALRVARRRRKIAERHLRGAGIEIGALHEPMPMPPSACVRYFDRLALAGLRADYPELADKPLVAPDILHDGEWLTTIGDASQDFVVANHFIEHCQDPLGAQTTFLRVLRPGGIALLAVPDRHQGIDAARAGTAFEHVQRDHEETPARSPRQHYLDWTREVDLPLGNVTADRVEDHARSLEERSYSIHFHAWDRREFGDMLERAGRTYDLPAEVLELKPNGHEFIVVLRRRTPPGR